MICLLAGGPIEDFHRILDSRDPHRLDQRFLLSAEEIKDFFERGFIIKRNLFSKEEAFAVKQDLMGLYEESKPMESTQVVDGTQFVFENGVIARIVWVAGRRPRLLEVGTDPRITVPAAQILGSQEIDQLICQAHYKMPGDNIDFAWHQDSQNRGYGTSDWTDVNAKGSYIQTLMAIDPMTLENGPVKFVPYSCDRGHISLDNQDVLKAYEDSEEVKTAVPLILEPGDVAMFSPYAIHGSSPNLSQDSRIVFINGFCSPGANRRVYPGAGVGKKIRVSHI